MPTHEQAAPTPFDRPLATGEMVRVGLGHGEAINLPQIMNQQTIAELTLADPQTAAVTYELLYLLKVTDPTDPDYQDFVRRVQRMGTEPSDYILVATTPRDSRGSTVGVTGMAFLHTNGGGSIVGRHGTTRWFAYGTANLDDREGWTPFDSNPSIARQHLRITAGHDGAIVTNLSQRSPTRLAAADATVLSGTETNPVHVADGPRRHTVVAGLGGRALRRPGWRRADY